MMMRFLTLAVCAIGAGFGLEAGLTLRATAAAPLALPPAPCWLESDTDPVISYRGKAGAQRGNDRLNREGFRDDEPRPDHGQVRVALLGDSVVSGDDFATMTGHLATILETDLAPFAPGAEVINLGITGTNTVQQVALLEQQRTQGERFDAVIIALNGGDADPTYRLDEGCSLVPQGASEHVADAGSRLLRLLRVKGVMALGRWHLDHLLADRFLAGLADRVSPATDGNWARVTSALGRLSRQGMPVGVLITPYAAETQTQRPTNPINQRLRQVVRTAKLPLLDLLPRLHGTPTYTTFVRQNVLHISPAGYARVRDDLRRFTRRLLTLRSTWPTANLAE